MPRSLRALLPACLASLAVAGPAGADTVIGEVLRPTPVSAYDRHVAWSAYDPAAGVYRLVLSVDGLAPDPVAVPPRAVPFDVDLGPGPGGGVDAVYSRCAVEPAPGRRGAGLPAWNTAAGCDLYRVDLDTGLELRLGFVNSKDASEYLPTIWRDRIAYARRYAGRPGRRGVVPYLYERSLMSARTPTRLAGGSRGVGGSARDTGQPVGIDMRGHRIAFAWDLVAERGGPAVPRSELRAVTWRGRRVLREAAWFPAGGGWLGPTQETSTTVVTGVLRNAPPFSSLRRYRLGSDAPTHTARRTTGPVVLSLSRDHSVSGARGTYALLGQAGGRCDGACRIVRLEPDPFG